MDPAALILDTPVARLVLRYPASAQAAIDTGTQHAYQARLGRRVQGCALAASVLVAAAVAGVFWKLQVYSPIAWMAFLLAMPLFCLPNIQRAYQRRAGMDLADNACPQVLDQLDQAHCFHHPQAPVLTFGQPPLAWQAEVAYLLFHPQGQARLRSRGLSRSLARQPGAAAGATPPALAPEIPFSTIPARITLRFPARALGAIDAGNQGAVFLAWVRLVEHYRAAWVGMAFLVLLVLLAAIQALTVDGALLGLLALLGFAAINHPRLRFRLVRAVGLGPFRDNAHWTLANQRLGQCGAFAHPDIGIHLTRKPLEAWVYELAYLLLHPQGQARLRRTRLDASLAGSQDPRPAPGPGPAPPPRPRL